MDTLTVVTCEASIAGLIFGAILALICTTELGKMLPTA